MIKLKLAILLIFILPQLFGQKTEKVYLDKKDSSQNYYTIIYPPKLPWKGYIVIVPGFGETTERMFEQTNLAELTAKEGLLTIIPILQDGVLSFGVDSLSQQSLNSIIEDVRNKHQLTAQQFYIGGFSIGGSAAIKYAENAKIKPAAVFGIDPPLDFERFYNSSKRDLGLTLGKQLNQENLYMVERIEKIFGGTPQTAIANFYKISPYSYSDTTQTAVKKFGNIPLRIYAEADLNWWLRERNADLRSMNVTDGSALINELNRLGNYRAELILTENKGYREPNHQRHPHSWSIMDNSDLVEWLITFSDN